MKILKIFKISLYLFVFVFGILAFNPKNSYANVDSIKKLSSRISVNIKGDKISCDITCRNSRYVKEDRYVVLNINLKSERDDFSGYLRVTFPGKQKNMFQKQISVKQGEQDYSLIFPAEFNNYYFIFSLVDKKQNVILSDNLGLNLVSNSEKIYIGVISENYSAYDYLDKSDSELFYMTENDLMDDYKVYDQYDCIIIDPTATSLSNDVILALKEWVYNGGTLVLSAKDQDIGYINEFASDMYSIKSIGSALINQTTFGLQKSRLPMIKEFLKEDLKKQIYEDVKQFLVDNLNSQDYKKWNYEIAHLEDNTYLVSKSGELYNKLLETYPSSELDKRLSLSPSTDEEEYVSNLKIKVLKRDITNINIMDSTHLILENNEPIIQYKDVRLGRVLFFETDISFNDDNDSKVLGTNIYQLINDNISDNAKTRIKRERFNSFTNNSETTYLEGLSKNDATSLPNLKLYAIIVVIYLIISCPLLYSFLNKRNRNMLLWVSIPAFSCFFSVLIFLLGSSTRLDESFVNYLSQIKVNDGGKLQMDTYFSIVPVKSLNLNMEFEENRDITPFFVDDDISNNPDTSLIVKDSEEKSSEYDFGIEYTKEGTSLLLNNNKSFNGKNFLDRASINSDEKVIADIYNDSERIYGKIINNFEADIKKAFIYRNGYIVCIGDLKKGEEFSFDSSVEEADVNEEISAVTKENSTIVSSVNYMTPQDYNYDLKNISALVLKENINASKSSYSITEQRMKSLIDAYVTSPLNTQGIYIYGFLDSPSNYFIDEMKLNSHGVTAFSENIDISYMFEGRKADTSIDMYAVLFDDSITDGINIFFEDSKNVSIKYKFDPNDLPNAIIYSTQDNPEFNIYSSIYSEVFNGNIAAYNLRTKDYDVVFESGVEKTLIKLEDYIDKDGYMTLNYRIDSKIESTGLKLPNLLISKK